jgi:hypothetical protein
MSVVCCVDKLMLLCLDTYLHGYQKGKLFEYTTESINYEYRIDKFVFILATHEQAYSYACYV